MRPDCLRRCLKSLEQNQNLEKVDFYLYQDGAINLSSGIQHTTDEKIKECIQVFKKSKLPNKFVRRQSHNIGAGLMRFYEFKELFDKGYEYVIHLDDDLIVNKHYIQTVLQLFKQFKNYPNIGMVQTLLRNFNDVPSKIKLAEKCKNQVQYGFGKRWEQGLWKHSWRVIEPRLQELIQLLKEYDFKLLVDRHPNSLLLQEKLLDIYGEFHVDAIIENCLIMEGFQGLTTRTNHHCVMENEGYYCFQAGGWKRAGHDKIVLFDVPPPKKFQIVNNKLCIAIRTFKRSNYLRETIQGLLKNVTLRDTDFYFYIDGAVNSFSGIRYANDSEPIRCLYEIQKHPTLPNLMIVMKKQNVQTAVQKYEMLSTLFPRYDYVMMLDDDLIVDEFYITTVNTLFEQFKDDPKAGILGTFFVPPGQKFVQDLTSNKAKILADKVQYGFGRRWEQGFWRESWEKIKPYYEIYMKYAGKCDYKQLLDDNPTIHYEREKILEYFPVCNADAALEFAAYRVGYLGLHTEVLRHKGIGIKGMYTYRTEEFWKDRGLDKVELFDVGYVNRFSFRTEMKYAEDCRDLFKDKIVYIVGSGPSLDTYPDNFLDDKIGITLHLAYLKYPDATFRGICESPIMEWFRQNRPEFFEKKSIFTNPFHPGVFPQHFLGHDLKKSPNSIFVRYIPDESYLFGTTFRELIRKAINGEPIIAGAMTTVLHSILFAVLTMGAKDIYLIGCDHSKEKDKAYYSLAQGIEARELRVRYRGSWYNPWMCNRQREGTEMFIDECKKDGIKIYKYNDYEDWIKKNESRFLPRFRPGLGRYTLLE